MIDIFKGNNNPIADFICIEIAIRTSKGYPLFDVIPSDQIMPLLLNLIQRC